jgi:hypothetical protein
LSALACPSSSQCTSLDYAPSSQAVREVTFDPAAPGAPAPVVIDSGSSPADAPAGFGQRLSCPTVSLCAVTDFDRSAPMGGNVREVTFDPSSPGARAPVIIGGTFKYFGIIQTLQCRSSSECVAVTSTGAERTFDPSSPSSIALTYIDDAGAPISAVACPTRARCVAVYRIPSMYVPPNVVFASFNPQRLENVKRFQMFGFTPTAVACPSASRCVAVTNGGYEGSLTSSTRPVPFSIDRRALAGVACPSLTQCTAVDDRGREVTFDPRSPKRHATESVDGKRPLTAVVCQSVIQCTAGDGSGREVTFNPHVTGSRRVAPIDPGATLSSIACPSPIECVAVDSSGREVTFNPVSRRVLTRRLIDAHEFLTSITCPTSGYCVAVDRGGGAVEGSPLGRARWRMDAISGANSLLGVSCSLATQCVAVDATGNAYVGRPH